MLQKEQCERIHDAALQVLERVGVRMDDPEIMNKLREAGVHVTGGIVVRLRRTLVNKGLRQSPESIRVAAGMSQQSLRQGPCRDARRRDQRLGACVDPIADERPPLNRAGAITCPAGGLVLAEVAPIAAGVAQKAPLLKLARAFQPQ